jgi:hypothetical protein
MASTSPVASVPTQVPPQFRYKRLYSFPYPISQDSTVPVAVPIELTKYAQTDYFARLFVQITGTVTVTGTSGDAGTAIGFENPEALLVSALLQTTPQLNGVTPVNQLSARGLLVDAMFQRGYMKRSQTPVLDIGKTQVVNTYPYPGASPSQTTLTGVTATPQPVNVLYEIYFKRPFARKGAEYDHAIAKYSSDLLTLQFGGSNQLWAGSTNTFNFGGLTVSIFADSDLNMNVSRIHNNELFERTYPITASQTDFPIDTLPQGYLYSDLFFLFELNNVLSNAGITNIDIEGGGRVWLPQGDNNATVLQQIDQYRSIITDPNFNNTGVYPVNLRDGMFTKGMDSLSSPLSLKLSVVFTSGATNLVRLIGRRMVPGEPTHSNPRLRTK